MLTATLWGYFASLQSYAAIAGSQAQIIDLPALQYGLFHAQVQPRKPFGLITTGISFKGLNMDVGHLRSIRWVKDDNPQSPINNKPELTQNGKPAAQNRWIAYNKAKGQYGSAQEHATPEAFWVDKSQCRYTDADGQTQQPCAEGISAVKAIAIAQQQGQKIYTINESNRATALPTLSIGGEAGVEIRNAIAAGKEVTFHENRISEHGWSGYGYIIVDPETGAGAYLIEGKGNGAYLLGLIYGSLFAAGMMALIYWWWTSLVVTAIMTLYLFPVIITLIGILIYHIYRWDETSRSCFVTGFLDGINFTSGFAVMSNGISSAIYRLLGILGIGTTAIGAFAPPREECII